MLSKYCKSLSFALLLVSAGLSQAQFHTNVITTPFDVYNYSVDGGPAESPTIELYAGVTNVLDIQTDEDHPVVVTTTPDPNDWYDGANPEDVNNTQIFLVTPATGYPSVLYYVCPLHYFYGEIHFSYPPPPLAPPQNTILSIKVGTNVVMTSTGTNTTWSLVPEYRSNLTLGGWAPVPSYTNTYANGTNTTVFNRLDPICGPNVYLRVRQRQN